MQSFRQRHAELCHLINEHNHAYYALDAPQIDDEEYDCLFAELRQLEGLHPELVSADSPTQRVGSVPLSAFVRVEHAAPMHSLDNVYDEAALQEFDRRLRNRLPPGTAIAYVAEPKIDGASVELSYRDGMFVQGSTRGDGRFGEDVTANLRTLRGLPLRIAEVRPLTLRGEVFIRRRDLQRINEERVAAGEEAFANSRNAAAGSLRLLDPQQSAERPLRIVLYEVVEPWFDSQELVLQRLRQLRLPTHGLQQRCSTLEEVWQYIETFRQRSPGLDYDTDGVVIKLDALALRPQLGATARHVRWAIAYKYPAKRRTTRLRAIHCDVGRTGVVTPVAELDPVTLSGTTVAHASLHNVDYVAAKDIRVGDEVVIEKAGEIIPQVVEVSLLRRPLAASPWQPPENCPACGSPLLRRDGEAALRCTLITCPGQLKAALQYFTRRFAMDIESLGPALIAQLVDSGLVADFADLFALPDKKSELLRLPRLAEKSVDRLLTAIDQARTQRSVTQLLTGLGIPLVGQVAARAISRRFASLPQLLAAAAVDLQHELSGMHGVGPKIAASFVTWMQEGEHRRVLQKLLDGGLRLTSSLALQSTPTGPLQGMAFCVTGVLSQPREAVHALIESAGGQVQKNVGRSTNFLVAGDKVGRAKRQAAEKAGVRILDEEGLLQLIATRDAASADLVVEREP